MRLLRLIIMSLAINITAQTLTLEYIFQEPQIINPRPSLKQINSYSNKIYYYADDDYDRRLNMFDYNYITGETYKYPDTGTAASEFVIMPGGDALAVIEGDVYISKNFAYTREFKKDLQITQTDEYEYSPFFRGNFIIYRRRGNFYIKELSNQGKQSNETALTNDESDSVSNQIIAIEETPPGANTVIRILIAKYNNSKETEYIFPDFTSELVTVKRNKRGMPEISIIELGISKSKSNSDSLQISSTNEIIYLGNEKLITIYADYSPDGSAIVLDAETLDRHRRILFACNTYQKTVNEIYSETDNAWYERHETATRFIGNNDIVFATEKSGYNSLYRINVNGSELRKIAGDNYTIDESVTDTRNGKIYFTANRESPHSFFIYETDPEGTYIKQVTSEAGNDEQIKLSADGKYIFYEHSYINKPNELYFTNLEDYSTRAVTNTISEKFREISWTIPELINYPNEEDGTIISAFVYKPADFKGKKKYPLICFAHGDGYLQNVTNGFSHYRDNFMVITYFTNHGYVVLDIDFRGSKGYGKEFRNKTYRNLGRWEVSDYISGINFLSNKGYIDKDRVGIYGGSYGGFVTLMAAFNHPEVFKAAVAMRPVCNWKYYYYSNKRYTVPRLGDYEDEDSRMYYEISSPVTYADKLEIPLLLIHGMQDDNVFFQDVVILSQKLIDEGKDFELMFYPKESHSFYLQSSWLDSYKRVYNFFEKNLKP